LVFDGDVAVAWCEYGSPEELSSIYHLKEYMEGLDGLPAYRVTCFLVDKGYRRKGVAAVALRGALDLISQAGGGVVEAYPPGQARQEDICLLPLQRLPQPFQAGRVRVPTTEGQVPLRYAAERPIF
jgi:hypothetical protein